MTNYKPSPRLNDLVLALKYDKIMTPTFKPHERFSINQERGSIMRGDTDFKQPPEIETKIQTALIDTKRMGWEPDTEIYE